VGRAFSLALAQLFTGPILSVLGICAVLSALTFVGVWFGVDYAVEWLWPDTDGASWLGWIEGFATLLIAWFLFPIVASLFIAMFLEHVCGVVERQHYPELPKAEGISLLQSLGVAVSYLGALVLANLLLLVLLFFPPVYAGAWFVVNGWLIGREYVELVALRRLSPKDVRELRARHSGESLVTGGVIALLMAMPLVNLVVPVFATALTVHRVHSWRREDASR
jgi:CysZ protein